MCAAMGHSCGQCGAASTRAAAASTTSAVRHMLRARRTVAGRERRAEVWDRPAGSHTYFSTDFTFRQFCCCLVTRPTTPIICLRRVERGVAYRTIPRHRERRRVHGTRRVCPRHGKQLDNMLRETPDCAPRVKRPILCSRGGGINHFTHNMLRAQGSGSSCSPRGFAPGRLCLRCAPRSGQLRSTSRGPVAPSA